jgi:uncharacterized protein YydD (DUF2326 family)
MEYRQSEKLRVLKKKIINREKMDFEKFNKTPVLLPFVMKNFRQRLQQTVRRHGEHWIDVILKVIVA